MSCRELIESLRRGSDEKVRSLWQEAEAEAGRIRSGIANRISVLRENSARVRAEQENATLTAAMNDAARRSRTLKREAEKILSERLFALAAESLAAMRDEQRYPVMFEKLFLELPCLKWQMVRVHPADAALARKYFPGSDIVPDKAISGGMDVSTGDGAIRVINTFEKRLERGWAELLPALVADVYREVADDRNSAQS